jgi:hypothetical protein
VIILQEGPYLMLHFILDFPASKTEKSTDVPPSLSLSLPSFDVLLQQHKTGVRQVL